MKIIMIVMMVINNSCVKNINTLSTINKDINDDLISAAVEGDKDKVISLLSKGANINYKDNEWGDTALMLASELLIVSIKGHMEIVKLLIGNNSQLNHKNKFGDTALIMASQNVHIEVVRLLLKEGADGNAKDYNGNTALIFVCNKIKDGKRNEYINIAYMLIKKMKDDYIQLFTSLNKDENKKQSIKDEIKSHINLLHNLENLPPELFLNIFSLINLEKRG